MVKFQVPGIACDLVRLIVGWGRRVWFLLTIPSVQARWVGGRNWGDRLTPFIINELTGKAVFAPAISFLTTYTIVGSVLGSSGTDAGLGDT